MPNKDECINALQSAVNMLYAFEEWENTAFVKALALGIQGKKRESRMAGTTDENIRKYLQSEAYDLFAVELYPAPMSAQFPAVSGIESFLTEYRKGLWDMYWKLHEAANMFVSPLCLRDLACPLYDRASCIRSAIIDINRKIKRWEDMKQHGTPLHDLFIYETTEYNNHDEAEKREVKAGYDY